MDNELTAEFEVHAGKREFLSLRSIFPHSVAANIESPNHDYIERAHARTVRAWREWSSPMLKNYRADAEIAGSARILKALTYAPSGAIIAAPTTSLPETLGGGRNWDYRFCWIRDSVYAAGILFKLGLREAADQLRAFIERSSAGSGEQLQTLYAIDGARRLTEIELDELAGYRNSAPVRIGNNAATQHQWDMYGELLQLAWLWYGDKKQPDEQYWEFLIDVLDHVCKRWREPDSGIWEFRDRSRHLVHSKACCWAALNYAIDLAQKLHKKAPIERWTHERESIRHAIDTQGFDHRRGVFRQAFDSDDLDAAILRLPRLGLIEPNDPRMLSSVEVIRDGLDAHGLLQRYNSDDGLGRNEGVFLPCTYWLVTCLAQQGKFDQAQMYYRNAMRCANDLGLFSEEYDTNSKTMLGNFPQALTHSSQIAAKMALLAHAQP